jgi:hypothetical protein
VLNAGGDLRPVYPVFRRSADGRHAYRIEGPRAFTEVQLIGQRALIHRVRDAAYPEQVLIKEMVEDGTRYLPMEEVEFLRLLDRHDGK